MLIVIGLIVAFVLVAIFSNRATRGCRWREYRLSGCDLRVRWHCVACGAEVFTSDGDAPRVCHAPHRSR
ncbi:hypothetical protein [Roseovarius sp. MBR-6]|jgi:hypothetical protein|uniref:hypothetical protein n=1 Tax=Roseovarius sp. MBR-6 TaxID=3156459 RepID=UPI00339271FC